MAYNDPENPRPPDSYIDQAGELGWAPILLGVALAVMLGYLIFAGPRADEPSRTAAQGELPSTTPNAPSVPAPPPPIPQ